MIIVHAVRRIFMTDGGPPRATVDLLDAMGKRGHETRLLCSMPRDLPASWLAGDGPHVTTFPTTGGPWGLATPSAVRRIRKGLDRADVVHLQMPWDPLNYQISRIARSMSVPYCVSLRGTLDDWAFAQKRAKKGLYLKLFARRLLEQAAFVHCTAQAEALQSLPRFPNGNIKVIPNLLDLRSVSTNAADRKVTLPGLNSDDRVVLFLGRVFPGKGVELLIDAFAAIAERHPNAVLVIAGSGSIDYVTKIRQRARATLCERRVLFAGFLEGDAKAAMYQRASVMVLASDHENFGNAIFEAAACGTPLVISREVALWNELSQGVGARIVDRNPNSISEAVSSHLSMTPSQAETLQSKSREWVARFLDRDRVATMYESAYSGAKRI